MSKKVIAIFIVLMTCILSIKFDEEIVDFLSQYRTTQTLLKYSDFWNERIHDWLGDTITLVGVMLAFSLPLTAQVSQWVVSTYGVTDFPEIIKDELKINRLLMKMFFFVGLVIFWRIFIYDISPHSSSLYILFNFVIATSFIWILYRLFKVIHYVLRCTFEFRDFIVVPAYNYIKKVTEDMQTPYSDIIDSSVFQNFTPKYLRSMRLLRDDEIAGFKRGNILNAETEGFEKYTWQYISAAVTTNDLKKIEQALVLQTELSASVKIMCLVFGKEYYARYVRLASSLAYYSVSNRYGFLLLEDFRKDQTNNQNYMNESISESEIFVKLYADLLFLAEEIEGKNNSHYYPILSCQFLLNHSSFGYLIILPKNIDATFDWLTHFERVDLWEKDIIELTRKLIQIASKNKKSSALLNIYHNLRNDLQTPHKRKVNLFNSERRGLKSEDYDVVFKYASKYEKFMSLDQVMSCVSFVLSGDFDKYFDINDNKKSELLQNLLRIRYKFRVDNLLLFWLGHLSFDTSIIINILEEVSPMDLPRVSDIGEHLIPGSIDDVFRQYFIVYDSENEYLNPFVDFDRYQIVFSTMVLYFLAKSLRSNTNLIDFPLSITNEIFEMDGLSIRNVKSLREIAKRWLDSPKGVDNNKGIRNLCTNYGISFDDLLILYKSVLGALNEKSETVIQKKILAAPINEAAIEEFYTRLNLRFNQILQIYSFDNQLSNDTQNNKKYRFMSIQKDFFIDADTGVHYVRDNLDQHFFNKCRNFLSHQENKIMVIFNGERPKATFEYKTIGNKISFYCKYNFYFK